MRPLDRRLDDHLDLPGHGRVTYELYAAFAVLSLLFVLRFVKETKGMTLEEMT